MSAIYKKEMKSYFYTATGWLFIAVFLSIAGLIFYLNNLLPRNSELTQFFSMMGYVWMLLTPVLVMRLFAGENRQNIIPCRAARHFDPLLPVALSNHRFVNCGGFLQSRRVYAKPYCFIY